ncbi:type I-B CRISPR-associated protein Cas7/Csh2 [Methanosarcina sp. Z-7115]|uniref:Type I-B CRISPR-associated protein Cas7/Csh2 n=1 Tax=Methanosarcina baikalica TaxID=3073890 RepID=A0ABU2CZQ5_9EURY|nr:type I-B CRISPR-associated protein Cas7/Csh2 [Methanosarcina sp. Z-7115]MDR7665199.1 type I-B CRISPR-associated protein Cas7/Csh2 [Methanosarcina sp. Z-7115]
MEKIKNRNEFLFLYDIKNGNPNGDPDENRPRIDNVTGKCYVTDVRLKRFIRDYLIQTEGEKYILVTKLGTKTVNLTDRVTDSLTENESKIKDGKIEGKDLMNILTSTFIDLRMFGSPLAFKSAPPEWGETSKITGPIQINFGETLNQVEEINFNGTSIFRSKGEADDSEQKQGTFTTYYAIPYGLIAFHGVINENSAATTGLSEEDLHKFKVALWKGVRESSSANTRTKKGQQPRLLLNIVYKEKVIIKENGKEREVSTEYHIGALEEKVTLKPISDIKEDINIRKTGEYTLDFTRLTQSITKAKNKIERVEYCACPEFKELYITDFVQNLKKIMGEERVEDLNIDELSETEA